MRNNKGKTIGFLGALIIHLVAAIIFMLIKIGTLSESVASEILVEFDEAVEVPLVEEEIELPPTMAEIFENNEEIYNIARNLSAVTEEKINIDEYIDKVKEELIQSGKLGQDNYIDNQKRAIDPLEKGEAEMESSDKQSETDKNSELGKIESAFTGPTRIYYDLPGRYHTYLPIPIYKCEGSGNVTLSIEVNPFGTVVKASIITASSTTVEECLIETAINAAMLSKFNSDASAPKIQVGTLTYQFVAQ